MKRVFSYYVSAMTSSVAYLFNKMFTSCVQAVNYLVLQLFSLLWFMLVSSASSRELRTTDRVLFSKKRHSHMTTPLCTQLISQHHLKIFKNIDKKSDRVGWGCVALSVRSSTLPFWRYASKPVKSASSRGLLVGVCNNWLTSWNNGYPDELPSTFLWYDVHGAFVHRCQKFSSWGVSLIL